MRRLAIFTICVFALAACASADDFTFTYTGTVQVQNTYPYYPSTTSCDPYCTGASGILNATFIGGNQWQVNSGSGTYTNANGQTFTINIAPGAGSDQYFIWDNIAYPKFSPLLDNGGLLFDVSSGQELNIFGWTAGSLYDALTAPPAYGGDAGGFSLTAVPDGGMTLMLLGSALFGVETLRRRFRA